MSKGVTSGGGATATGAYGVSASGVKTKGSMSYEERANPIHGKSEEFGGL